MFCIQYIHIWFLLPGLRFKGLVFWFVIKSTYLTYSSHPGRFTWCPVVESCSQGQADHLLSGQIVMFWAGRHWIMYTPEEYMGWNLKSWWFGWKMIFRISRGPGILRFQPLIFRGVDRKGCWLFCCVLFVFPRFSTSKWIKQHKRLEQLVTLIGFCEGILRIGYVFFEVLLFWRWWLLFILYL